MTAMRPTFEQDVKLDEQPFRLEAGGELPEVTLRCAWYGHPESAPGGVMLICHALTGSARIADWWGDLVGPGHLFDPERYALVGINVLGSCYGSTGPPTIDPRTGRPYAARFPLVTIGDIVRAQALALQKLGIARLSAVVGGSIGGMQALRWAVDFPDALDVCCAIGATPLPAMGLALNHLQRRAIQQDPAWQGGDYTTQPAAGLALARAIAMCSYKSAALFDDRFGRHPDRSGEDPRMTLAARYDVAGYLDHQGEKFVRRFDANSYLILSKAMDTFDLAAAELARIRARVHLIGLSSDWLFPASAVRALAERMRTVGVPVEYAEVSTDHGHDGFLAEPAAITPLLRAALEPTRS
ncbi:homoserine O-acetyltransferase [Chloracidobacterium validum]|uniref:Homoserine O-acetyltransferase n=2 Tax=Chloracidobacterium validum TaxID=2821543 RepID=A0ABX8BBB8_9BACT|nr:homoserine O-acetyltransferase [Chloracidobacterium validum]